MSQVTLRQVGDGGGGSPSPPTKKGFKFDKKMLYILGGLAVVVALLFTRKQASVETYQELPVEYPIGAQGVSNGVDVQSQLDQFGSIISNSVDATLSQAMKEMQNNTNSLLTEQNNAINDKLKDFGSNYNDQMSNLHGQMNDLGQMNSSLFNQIQQNMAEQLASLRQQQSSMNVDLTPSVSGSIKTPAVNKASDAISSSSSALVSGVSQLANNLANKTNTSSNSTPSKGVSSDKIQKLKDRIDAVKK